MRKCLCLGRLLRSGRGTASPCRRIGFPQISSVQTRQSSTGKFLTPDERSFLHSHRRYTAPAQFSELYNEDRWMQHLMPCLQPITKSVSLEGSGSEPTGSIMDHADKLHQTYTLRGYLDLARKVTGLDLLVYLGFTMKDWSAVQSVLDNLVDAHQIVAPYISPLIPSPGFDWAIDGRSLDQLTSLHTDSLAAHVEPILEPGSKSLDELTVLPVARTYTDRIVSDLLLNLGSLVLAAADRPPSESMPAMACVYRTLARLHSVGVVSDRVYQYRQSDPNRVTFRPPGLHFLSSYIMSVLSDAAWQEHQAALSNAAAEAGKDPPFLPFAVGVRELGPEIWLELILWCCVEHGFADIGSYLVRSMAQRTGDLAWKIESWTPLILALDVVQQTNIRNEQFWRRPGGAPASQTFKRGAKPPFNGLGERTISREIVECLRNGLANQVYNGVGFFGFTPTQLIEAMKPLTVLLDPPKADDDLHVTKKTTNWDINRILESGCIRPADDPVTFERVLRSSRNAIPPWETERTVAIDELNGLTEAQLYDETAAMVGLLEFNIKTFTARGQAARAFYQFAWLQNIYDASKTRHIEAFFEKLRHADPTEMPLFDANFKLKLHPHLLESCCPLVSDLTLAELLDLAVSSRAYGFGQWLLFNSDIDGPAIPPRSYRNQALAPSILRFAAASKNRELSERVILSLEPPLSVNTLKAIATYYMAVDDWDRAILTLEYLRDFKVASWGFSNLSALAAKIIQLHTTIQRQKSNEGSVDEKLLENFMRAKDLLRRFYAEEFNTPRSKNPRTHEFQQKVLQRQQEMFLSFPGIMANLAKQIVLLREFPDHELLPWVPPVSFQTMLSAIVEAHGSIAGKRLWTRWCQAVQPPQVFRQKEGGVKRLGLHAEREPWRLVGDPEFRADWYGYMKSKAVAPDLNGLRVIARAAMREYEEQEKMPYMPIVPNNPEPRFHRMSSRRFPQTPISTPFGKKAKSKSRPYTANIPRSLFKYQTEHGGQYPETQIEAVLDFCVFSFLRAGLPEKDVELEVPGHMQRLRMRDVFKYPEITSVADRYYEIQDQPWMQVFMADAEATFEADAEADGEAEDDKD